DDSAVDKTFLTQASFELAHDRMVEVITDVAPWVPDWDELKTIDLRGRKLESVVRLKEFLPKLEEVALDDNEISYFTGLPSTLKSLTVSFNQVPSIASFGHLLHLETLDISHNEVDDLSSLECLQHLRYLKADNNGIKTLNGILALEHLHTLSLRDNKLTVLNLQTSSWRKLSTLDVSHNRIVTIRGLMTCRHLKSLNVSSNDLSRLDLEPSMPKLRVLRVSSNARLSELDVLPAKDLRTLYADFCALERIEHLGSLSKLENISVRQQLNDRGGFVWPGSQVKDAKRLFLSANAFSRDLSLYASAPRAPPAFTQLVYLELSACQLETLPSNFSSLFPTLHHLNLDHNLFSKLPKRCLSGLRDLKRLSMVGSRMGKTRNLLEALEGCQALSVLDTRMNPLTLGLYPPMLLTSPAAADNQHASASHLSHTAAASSTSTYALSDARFARTLPESFALKRLLHRGTLGMVCPRLEWLDGLVLADEEVRAAEQWL
ncbi:L domain-like protein, partial [Microstroma glucosiphilum]